MKVVELEIYDRHEYPNPRLNIGWDVIRKETLYAEGHKF